MYFKLVRAENARNWQKDSVEMQSYEGKFKDFYEIKVKKPLKV